MNDNDKSPLDKTLFDTWHDKILAPVSDNLKTAESLVVIQDLLKDKNTNTTTKLELLKFVDDLLGLQFIEHAQKLHDTESETAPADIQELAQKRSEAKKNRDFATADSLREQIESLGWSIKDSVDGFKLVKKQ